MKTSKDTDTPENIPNVPLCLGRRSTKLSYLENYLLERKILFLILYVFFSDIPTTIKCKLFWKFNLLNDLFLLSLSPSSIALFRRFLKCFSICKCWGQYNVKLF